MIAMNKTQVVERIKAAGLVAVVRAESAAQAFEITDALLAGGVAAIEITYTVPGAGEVIRELTKRYADGEVLVGAGTVLDPETARDAILNGAQFVVSPCFNAEMVRLCNRYRVAVMPGAMTVKEVVECMEAGADIVKVFPGELFGAKVIKAFRGPLPQAELMPTGGVTLENVGEWIANGAVAVGVGGQLTAGAKTGDYAAVTEAARAFTAKIREARGC